MTFRPKHTNKKTFVFAIATALLAIVLFALSAFVSAFNGLYQFSSLILAIVSVQIYLKYVACDYIYEAAENSFKIYKVTGKKSICLCSLSYEGSLSTVLPYNEYLKQKDNFSKCSYAVNYNKNIKPLKQYVYLFEFNSKVLLMKFEPDERFAEYLNQKINACLNTQNSYEDTNNE